MRQELVVGCTQTRTARATRVACLITIWAAVTGCSNARYTPGADPTNGGGQVRCESPRVAVRIATDEPAEHILVGDLCYSGPHPPAVVQVLLAGATYSRRYWDPDPRRSYVAAAVRAGYAVFNADRIGTGESSHPHSGRLDATAGAVAVADLIAGLRNGTAVGFAFPHVVLVGHSLGAAVAWLAARSGVDALVVTSELHAINRANWNALRVWPAKLDQRFIDAGLDDGYVTTAPGSRALFHHTVTADVVEADEGSKDVSSLAELAESERLVDSPAPDESLTKRLSMPVLIMVGAHDPFFCQSECSVDTLRAQEQPYYASATRLDLIVMPGMGHSLNLANRAHRCHQAAIDWLIQVIPPGQ